MKKKLIHPSGKSFADVAQIFRIMKLISLFLFIAMMQLSAATYSQTTLLKISGQNLKLGEIFDGIEKQSEFSFFYNVNQIDLSKKVDINAENQVVNKILDEVLAGTGMTYTISNKLIVIHKLGEPVSEFIAQQQGNKITGKVTDQAGMIIPGASVVIKGTTYGTVTDNNGVYTLANVSEKSTLVCSFVGMRTQEVVVGTRTNISFTLSEVAVGIDEIAVIGYGTVRKKDLTGAVGSVSSADIVRTTPANATQALQGQVPGVVVTKGSNLPGQAFSIDIRGENTITGVTEPLVVIDGVIGGRLRDINPADIQSIDILKDASSTAIYGSRGANGVVIITSKKGVSGRPYVSVDSYFGVKTPAHLPQLQNAQQFYKSMLTDVVLNLGSPTTFSTNEMQVINSGGSVNWVSELTKPSVSAGTTVAVTGGSPGTTYRFFGWLYPGGW